MEDVTRTWPTKSTKRAHVGSQRQKQQAQGLHGSVPCALYIYYGCQLGVLVGPKRGSSESLTLCLFLLLDCLVRPPYEGVHLVLLYLVLSCLAIVSYRLLFSEEETERQWIWVRRRQKVARRSRWRRKCSWDILYERRIYF